MEKKIFGKLDDGTEVFLFTLKNKNGMKAEIITYGATVVSLTSPDRNNNYKDIVLGYDSISGYVNDVSYFGSIVGRFGNRIAKGQFSIDGIKYQLTINNNENHLHGGKYGFNKKNWDFVKSVEDENGMSLILKYLSKDGEEGYPGNLEIYVTYSVTNNDELKIEYSATTDKKTIINPTHHSYFNLTANPNNTILDHELMINAEYYTPVNSGLIPLGKLEKVENTPFDFRSPKKIGKDIDSDFDQLKLGLGYDHNFVINRKNNDVIKIAEVYEPTTGRFMEVFSDQPGLQFYSGNFLNGTAIGKNGIKYNYRTSFCLEAQHFPDSPNQKDFPSVFLKPGEVYKQTTIYKFSSK
ncbi:MAG: galactose mutarotase [Melioribacteraceae bacterium]|nr:galactose mutarotase [Melioribacteraceae bacterium]